MNGWLKLHREILQHWTWTSEPFSKGQAWIDILLHVNFEDKIIGFDGKPIQVKKGDFLTSTVKLSERWRWSRTKILTFLNDLEREKMIVRKSDNRKTLITVTNWNIYQDDDTAEKQQKDSKKTSDNTTERHRQEIKNLRNKEIKKRDRVFKPPTLEEIIAYVEERKSCVNPQDFFEYYDTGEWKDAKGNQVKNWKQKLLTWENREQEKQLRKNTNNSNPIDDNPFRRMLNELEGNNELVDDLKRFIP